MSGIAFWRLLLLIMNGNNYTLEIIATFLGSLIIAGLLINYVIMPNQEHKMAEFNKVVKEITGISPGTISTNINVPAIK